MPIDFSAGTNTTQISRPPRVIHTTDPTAGCPPTRAVGTQIALTTVVITRPAWFYVQGRMIRSISGRTDLFLKGSGPNGWSNTTLRQRLNWTNSATWDHVHFRYNTYVSNTGTYTFWMDGQAANTWGCGSDWGSLSVFVQEV